MKSLDGVKLLTEENSRVLSVLSFAMDGSRYESKEVSLLALLTLLYVSLLMDLLSLEYVLASVDLLLQEDKLGLLESRTEDKCESVLDLVYLLLSAFCLAPLPL